jgi:hypothetical protein
MYPIVASVTSVRFVAFTALLAALGTALASSEAAAQTQFFAVGDLPGGGFHSEIRDATRIGSTILAVGNGNGQTAPCANPCQAPGDTAILWRWDGSTGTLTALPNLVVNTLATSIVTASAITPDGQYVASRARSLASGNARQAVRVTTALVPLPSANLNLANFSPALSPSTAAVAISRDGAILYGFSGAQAVRFDTDGATSAPITPPAPWAGILPAPRGTSADGSVMVANGGTFSAGQAFRYTHGSPSGNLAPIPKLDPSSTWNGAVAVSADGNLVLVAGNSPAYPNGEVYLHNATTGAATSLGSPNRGWSPNNAAGMTDDASVIALNFGGATRNFAYFRNSHGWFLVASALGAQGIDVKADGWTELGLTGMSADGTLLFGSGVHHDEVEGDRVEGWVARFPPGYLANFNPQPVAPSNTSIVGAWRVNDTESGSPAVVVFVADGTYYHINTSVTATEVNAAPGFERGLYTLDAATGAFTVTTLNDTNGDAGLSDTNGALSATLFVSGDSFSLTEGGPAVGTRVTAATSPLNETLTGAWLIGNAAQADGSFVAVFDNDGTYYHAQDGPSGEVGAYDGIETGTFVWDPVSFVLRAAVAVDPVTSTPVDTNGDWGLSDPFGDVRFQPSGDGLTAQAGDDSGLMTAYRIIAPNAVVPAITSPLSAAGTLGAPFSYTIAATNGASTFGATGLPSGLSISGATIAGTPTVIGSFIVTLTAGNTLSSGGATLTITIATTASTSTGSNVTVTPEVPPGTPPLSVTFDNVGTGGTTSVTLLDPESAPALPPASGYSIGSPAIYYDISTTAALAPGSGATLCFDYSGIDFGGDTPRLLHYEGGAWTDITTSVEAATTTVCGLTTSFSPFTIVGSSAPFYTRTGFYSPVSMVPGFVNTAKGGSTIPLMFNVHANGVEVTDTAGLEFAVLPIACDAQVAEDQIDWVTSDTTSLRYDGQHFHQNWKTPKGAGCYIARITTAADGKSISARFKLR